MSNIKIHVIQLQTAVLVNELYRRAGISRNDFYLRYTGLRELSHEIVSVLMDKMSQECLASTNRVISTEAFDQDLPDAIFDALEENERLLRALLREDSGVVPMQPAHGLSMIYVAAAKDFGKPYESADVSLMCSFVGMGACGIQKGD